MFDQLSLQGGNAVVTGVPDGAEAYVLAGLLADAKPGLALVFVARDASHAQAVQEGLAYFAPAAEVLDLPAWDCLPYDRVSPNPALVARRLTTLSRLVREGKETQPTVLLTTVNAILQRLPEPDFARSQSWSARPGNRINLSELIAWLETNGFARASTVQDTGEYAVRGGIVDVYAPGMEAPVRLDFFGDTLESLRAFDTETQRTTKQLKNLDLVAMSEVVLSEEAISRFRKRYVARFGATDRDDILYQSISEGRRYAGMEHWLPLFHEGLATLFDYCGGVPVVLAPSVDEVVRERFDQVAEHHQARVEAQGKAGGSGSVPYKPLDPDALYLSGEEWTTRLADGESLRLSSFDIPPGTGQKVVALDGRQGRSFAAERGAGNVNVFDALATHAAARRKAGDRIVIACWSEGSRERLSHVLADHGLDRAAPVETDAAARALPKGMAALAVLGVEQGFEIDGLTLVCEQDILGDRLVRQRKRRAKGANVLTEAASLAQNDLVVHVDHGIGRFIGLKTIEAAGAPHDCLELQYAGGDKLFLPVENIELLTRYGSEDTEAQLDKLGGGAWQARKARMKKRILEIADGLIKTAAARALRTAPPIAPPEGVYDEFATRFPYDETEDQLNAIDAVFEDLASGRPMDRLVCGDVGFGKTEVALRAAFIAAMTGRQVALVVPTTLLARQHYKTFSDRFQGLPINVAHASRLVPAKELAATKKGITDGSVDIVIGTHALLAKGISFRDLGLLIIDEEQHFRRQAQGTAEGAQVRGSRADPLGNADPQDAATGPDRGARAVADRHAAGRPAGGSHVHFPLRPRRRARGAAARTLSRRPELLCLPACFRPCRPQGIPGGRGAGSEGCGCPWPDAARRAGRRDERLLRGQVRRASVDDDR